MISSIFDLPIAITSFSQKDKALFDSIFSLQIDHTPMQYASNAAHTHVSSKFGVEKKHLLTRHTIGITNWVFSQQTFFNPLRANRPNQQVAAHAQETLSKDCDFCHVTTRTPHDPFGRIETNYSITAANAGATSGLHGLVIPKNIHNPFEVPKEVFIDMLNTAQKWFEKAHAYNAKAIYPSIIWNVGARAGASLFHPHLQVFLTETPYFKTQQLYDNATVYKEKYKQSFFTNFILLMRRLGLAKQLPSSTLFASLTPIKDKEILLFGKSSKFDQKLFKNIAHTLSLYKKYGVERMNMGITLPPLDNSWKDFPPIIRFIDRGVDGKPSDVAGMEFFFASVASTDPFVFARKLFS